MGNNEKIMAIKYNWGMTSLNMMKDSYFKRLINVFDMFEVVVRKELVSETFVDTKRNHIVTLLAHDEIIEAWASEYGRVPNCDDIETIYSLLKFMESEYLRSQGLSFDIKAAMDYFNQYYNNESDNIMSSQTFCIHEWKPNVIIRVNGLVVNIDYNQKACAIMHESIFDQHNLNLSDLNEERSLSLNELITFMNEINHNISDMV